MSKSELGQFYTTNYSYILSNMDIPCNINLIVEPFVGKGDLLKFLNSKEFKIEAYDIDPKYINSIKRDTLLNPPNYNNKFILTNPPYLAKNKNSNKSIYNKYKCDDLYKCFIKNIIENTCQGGIIIVPLNFLSSVRKSDLNLRKSFLEVYNILKINVFEEQVFEDTSYTVCAINFIKLSCSDNLSLIYIYPSKRLLKVKLNFSNNYTIGGEVFNLPQDPKIIIERLTKSTKNLKTTNIYLKCIDDNAKNKLGFKIIDDKDIFIDNSDNLSARSFATIVTNKCFSIEIQGKLVENMNSYINQQREKYNSLFLTNYRESNTIARKRISFKLAFMICNYFFSNYK